MIARLPAFVSSCLEKTMTETNHITGFKDARAANRDSTQLKTIINVKESEQELWKETTIITSISRTGAGFTLPRSCGVGRLVQLILPMPVELRAYDHGTQLYSVIGLVQYCNPAVVNGVTVYHVGIGFIGNEPPESFQKNPLQSYCITGTRPDGMWTIKEVASPFKNRRHPRYGIRVPVNIAIPNPSDRTVAREETLTANISAGGVSIVSKLKGEIGDKVKFGCRDYDFYAMAVIRGRVVKEGRGTLLHLQFIDAEFPVDKLLIGETTEPPPVVEVEQFFYR